MLFHWTRRNSALINGYQQAGGRHAGLQVSVCRAAGRCGLLQVRAVRVASACVSDPSCRWVRVWVCGPGAGGAVCLRWCGRLAWGRGLWRRLCLVMAVVRCRNERVSRSCLPPPSSLRASHTALRPHEATRTQPANQTSVSFQPPLCDVLGACVPHLPPRHLQLSLRGVLATLSWPTRAYLSTQISDARRKGH